MSYHLTCFCRSAEENPSSALATFLPMAPSLVTRFERAEALREGIQDELQLIG